MRALLPRYSHYPRDLGGDELAINKENTVVLPAEIDSNRNHRSCCQALSLRVFALNPGSMHFIKPPNVTDHERRSCLSMVLLSLSYHHGFKHRVQSTPPGDESPRPITPTSPTSRRRCCTISPNHSTIATSN